ncbi:MAG: sigma-54 dependent transcriptional regulator [Candidatus Cloacimonetes bacterium]|nr:sigma-54 dependent transcriptional regulator [Candidatus Cloacimonadota bacterium]
MISDARILIIDDDADILFTLRVLLESISDELISLSDPQQIPQLLASSQFDVILLDMNFSKDAISGEEGFHWLQQIRHISPDTPVILITAYGDIEKAMRAVRAGAYDFITKPWQNEKIIATVNAAVRYARSCRQNAIHSTQRDLFNNQINLKFQDIIGNSPQITELFATIKKVAPTDAEIIITGENGTGKELIARAIHRHSARAEHVFLTVDMGAVNRELFDSELFGHVKGAFTGASQDRIGKIIAASGGTLFLDEIGNLPLDQQTRLLKVLEDRRSCPLGSNKYSSIDIRLICATNTNLDEAVEEGRFRRDLLYRLNTIEINIPPLRQRKEDIPLLCSYYLQIFNQKYHKNIKGCSQSAMNRLADYDFPGNVRELKHIIQRAVILCATNTISADDLSLKSTTKGSALRLQSLNIDAAEEKLVREALLKAEGNMSRAAKLLGINRTSLYRRLKKYGL